MDDLIDLDEVNDEVSPSTKKFMEMDKVDCHSSPVWKFATKVVE